MYWSRSVSADRKAKMKKQEERDRRQRAKWVETYERILPLVGAKDLFQRLPEPSRENIRRLRFQIPRSALGTISIEQMSGKKSGRQSLRHSISSLSRPAMDMRFRLGIAFGSFSLFERRSTNYGWNPLMAPSLSWWRKPGRNWGQCSMS